MTDRIALFLFLVIVAAVVTDLSVNDGQALLFLGKKFFVFLDWLAFWR